MRSSRRQARANMEASRSTRRHLSEVLEREPSGGRRVLHHSGRLEGEIMRPQQILPFIHALPHGQHATVNQTALSLYRCSNTVTSGLLQPSRTPTTQSRRSRVRADRTMHAQNDEREVDLGAITLPAGTNVVCWIASANQDETQWGATADVFDITRSNASTIAFGGTACLPGSWLARLELRAVPARSRTLRIRRCPSRSSSGRATSSGGPKSSYFASRPEPSLLRRSAPAPRIRPTSEAVSKNAFPASNRGTVARLVVLAEADRGAPFAHLVERLLKRGRRGLRRRLRGLRGKTTLYIHSSSTRSSIVSRMVRTSSKSRGS